MKNQEQSPAEQSQMSAASNDQAATKRTSGTTVTRESRQKRQSGSSAALRTQKIARAGLIAALYAALTLVTMTLLGGFAFGPIQLRLSEVVCVLALFTPQAIPGLTIGCIIANLLGIALNGSGALGLLDVIGGSTATFLGAWWCWRMRSRVGLALLGPVVANALVVAAYLPLVLAAAGFYTIPFTDISLIESYPLMYLFGVLTIGTGEAVVVYGLGMPLQAALKRTPFFSRELEGSQT